MLFLLVEFEPNGRRYLYQSPVTVEVSSIVLVNVYGVIKAAKVMRTSQTKYDLGSYTGHVNTIAGLGFMLEDLGQPVGNETQEVKPSTVDKLVNWITTL